MTALQKVKQELKETEEYAVSLRHDLIDEVIGWMPLPKSPEVK